MTGDASLRLEVQGHTDDSGSPEHNAKLSGDRATSVRDWLIAHGIAASRLTSKGYGATKPVADNHTPEGKAKNRRVEVRLMTNVLGAETPSSAQSTAPNPSR